MLTESMILAKGKGVKEMLDICHEKGYSNDNTIVSVKDPYDLDSEGIIYAKE